jgi:hypothetical protein
VIAEIAVVAAVVIGALAFMVLSTILAHRVGFGYAQRRLERALAPGEKLVFQARCARVRLLLLIWGTYGSGTIYVTDRRVLWKTDRGLLPTPFEPLPIFEVNEASIRRILCYSTVQVAAGNRRWELTPYRFAPFQWPLGNARIAEALRDRILNHPQRQPVSHA